MRPFFDVDAERIALATISELVRQERFPKSKPATAIQTLGLDPEKLNLVAA